MALAAVGAFVVIRKLFGGPSTSEFKCVTCCHCRKVFHDGVMCGFQARQVFKNPAQISMCPDHETRRM